MGKYKIGRPLSDVRLRNWDSGRLASLKLAVQRLESEVNNTLASSSLQSAKRFITDQVPFVLNFSVAPGFRQAVVDFTAPPGLGGHPRRQLLFYELQHASDSSFSDPTTITTPNTRISIAGFDLGETRSFRARVINTINEASEWSDTVTVTMAQSEIQQTFIDNVTTRLTSDIGDWQEIFSETYQPVEGKSCANVHLGLACPHFDVTEKDSNDVTRRIFYGGPATVQFRWKVARFNSVTQEFDTAEEGVRCILSARPGFEEEAADYNSIRTPTAFGTFMLPFFKPEAGVNTKVILEAAKMPGSSWLGPTRGRAEQTSDPILFTRGAQIIESVEDF